MERQHRRPGSRLAAEKVCAPGASLEAVATFTDWNSGDAHRELNAVGRRVVGLDHDARDGLQLHAGVALHERLCDFPLLLAFLGFNAERSGAADVRLELRHLSGGATAEEGGCYDSESFHLAETPCLPRLAYTLSFRGVDRINGLFEVAREVDRPVILCLRDDRLSRWNG